MCGASHVNAHIGAAFRKSTFSQLPQTAYVSSPPSSKYRGTIRGVLLNLSPLAAYLYNAICRRSFGVCPGADEQSEIVMKIRRKTLFFWLLEIVNAFGAMQG